MNGPGQGSAGLQLARSDASHDKEAPQTGSPGNATQATPDGSDSDRAHPTSRPEAFRLTAEPPRVMRLSRKVLASVAVVTCLAIGGMLVYALKSPHQTSPANLISTTQGTKADVVTGAAGSYDTVPKLGPPLPGDLGRPILAAQQGVQTMPPPLVTSAGGAAQARQQLIQERRAARESRLFMGNSSGGGTPPLTSLSSAGVPREPSAGDANMTPVSNGTTSGQAAKRTFLQMSSDRSTASAARPTLPASPYILQAGSIIPAALITGIRSDLPGQITAQVTQNIYDSPTGQHLIIPQGARLIGEYDSQISSGQNRVLLAWDRLILPGGRSLLLDRQPGADASGFAGLQDKVNNHWGNMLRAAAISTPLGVGTEMATDSNDALVQALRYGTQDTINQIGKQIIQREIGVAPTLTIRPGYQLRVIVTRDIIIEPEGGRQ